MTEEIKLLIEALKQAPALAIMAAIVWMFLKYLKGQNEFIRTLHRENMDARKHSQDVIEKNTEATAEMTEVMRQVARNK